MVKTVKGAELENVIAKHPFYDRESLVMFGEHVTADAGTGCVHTAPGHGEDDFIVGQKYGLGRFCPVDDKGVMTDEAPGFEGIFYDKANKAITEKLEEVGALLNLNLLHTHIHMIGGRKNQLFSVLQRNGLLLLTDSVKNLLEAIKEIKWVPSMG